MHDAGGELLAAARRTGDEHAAVGRRHLLDGLAKLVDGGGAADHLEAVGAPLAQLAVLAFQLRGFERAGDDEHEAVGLERLLDIVVGAALDGGDGGLDIAVTADDHHRQVGMGALDAVEQLKPVELRALQPNVQDHQGRPALLDGRKRLVGILGKPRAMAFVL